MKHAVRYAPRQPARGVINPARPHMTQAVVSFEHDTFAELRARALRNRRSFAEEVRILVEWGLIGANNEGGL